MVIEMYEVVIPAADDFVQSSGEASEKWEPKVPNARRGQQSEHPGQDGFSPFGKHAWDWSNIPTPQEISPAAGADARDDPAPPEMYYNDDLSTADSCIRLWISVILVDKLRGDKLTSAEREILSFLGLEASWVQRMIDNAPDEGRLLNSRAF